MSNVPDSAGASPSPRLPQKARQDRMVKIAFGAITVAVVLVVYWMQTTPPVLPHWGMDLDAALKQARQENRRVLAVFLYTNPSAEDRQWLIGNAIAKNEKRIDEGQFLRVKVTVPDNNDSPAMRKFGVKAVPTLMIIGPDGNEIVRMEGARAPETGVASMLVDGNFAVK